MAKSCCKKPAASTGTARKAKEHASASRHGSTGAPMANARAMASTANVSPMFYHGGERFALTKADVERLVHKTVHQSRS